MTALNLLHQITLRNGAWGGLEQSFCGFIDRTRADPELRHFLVENLRSLAPDVEAGLAALAAPAREVRRWHGLPLPKWPPQCRHLHALAFARRHGVNAVLNWNLFGDCAPARLARGLDGRAFYWERGAAWFGEARPQAGFQEAYDLYLANSGAARQMLIQRWGVQREIAVCTPPVFNAAFAAGARRLPAGRCPRLGFAARLRAFKGGVLAVHAVAALKRLGLDAELWVAGDGRDELAMRREVARLGIDGQVRFLGRVLDMPGFYRDIDLLLHPALREPFGNSCSEALSSGLPVVATCVDGLPEVVDDGLNGRCVIPALPLSDYAGFGGDAADVYPLVYRPETGRVAAPGLPAPQALASAVSDILGDGATYAAYSNAAAAAYERKFSVAAHVQRLKGLLQGRIAPDAAASPQPA